LAESSQRLPTPFPSLLKMLPTLGLLASAALVLCVSAGWLVTGWQRRACGASTNGKLETRVGLKGGRGRRPIT
jgi:hypothetical protein